eukprot:jgi/Mesvir1/24995/Mv16954-RA.1
MSRRSKEFRNGQQGHRRGNQQGSVNKEQASLTPTTFVALQAEAEKLRKQVERSEGGSAALPRWERLALCYRRLYEASQLENRGAEEQCDSLFLLGTCLQEWAEALRVALPAPGVPDNATHLARELCREGATLLDGLMARLRTTPSPATQPAGASADSSSGQPGGPSQAAPSGLADVAANCGNTYATWAELASPSGSRGGGSNVGDTGASWQQSAQLFQEAAARYEASLCAAPHDAQVLGHLAECLVKRGEALLMLAQHTGAPPSGVLGGGGTGAGGGANIGGAVRAEADALFARGLETYLRALACAGQINGGDDDDDDVPGLLYNFGVSLYMAAQMAASAAHKSQLLQEAERRLRHASSFNRLDPLPLNALGDVLVARGELLHATAHAMVAGDSSDAALVVSPSPWPQAPGARSMIPPGQPAVGGEGILGVQDQARVVASQAYTALQAAVADGYQQALNVSRHDVDAQVGMAEVWVVMGKCRRRDGDAAGAYADFVRALRAYVTLVGGRDGLGTAHGKLRDDELADLLYNCACVAALVGDVGEGGVAAWALQQLAVQTRAPVTGLDQWGSDEDLVCLQSQAWFQAVVAQR